MENCVIVNENGAFYKAGTYYKNAWTNLYGNALLMSEGNAVRVAKATERAERVIKNYKTVNPDGITQGVTILNLRGPKL